MAEDSEANSKELNNEVFAKTNSLIKNTFEEKSLIIEQSFFFFLENSSYLVYLGQGEDQANHGTVRKSAISPQPGNQKMIK